MSEATIVDAPATTAPAVKVPAGPRIPKVLQGVAFSVSRPWTVAQCARRYGNVFSLNIPVYGRTVVVADPQLAKQLFMASPEDVGNIQPNLSRLFGSGSVFALDGAEHRKRRRLLAPPFHGKSIKNYEKIFEEETLRESANWPEGQAFETLEPMMRITLNAILRAVFGAVGTRLDDLHRIIPPWATLGSRLAILPTPMRTYGRYSPWGRLAEYRRQYDDVINRLIDEVKADPKSDDRDDVLALLLRSTYEDGSAMSRKDIGDELLTLLAAGHETTAATLGWAFERISRHPEVLVETRRRSRERRQRVPAGHDPRSAAGQNHHRPGRPPRLLPDIPARRMGYPAGLFDRGRHLGGTSSRAGVPESGAVRSATVHRKPPAARVDSVRRRHPALRGRRVRERGDGRSTANGVAALHYRDDDGAGREDAFPRGGLHAEGRRPHRGAPP